MTNESERKAGKRLTALEVLSLPPGKHSDRLGSGLLLLVTPTGGPMWVQRLTIRGKRRDIGLGSILDVSLEQAREKAFENRRTARNGGDPLAQRQAEARTITFAQAAERYMANKLHGLRNEKHKAQWGSTLKTYANPVLGDMQVEEIEPRDVLRALQPIWQTKTETASRVRGRVEAVLSWATVAGYRSGPNPARWAGNLDQLLAAPSRVGRGDNHPAVQVAQAPAWFADLRTRDGIAARALEFAALTAARSGEVRGATWAEIDMDRGVWTVPAGRMKAAREHRVALPEAAVQLLRDLPRFAGSVLIFPGQRGGPLSDMSLSAVMRRQHESETKAGLPGFLDAESGRPAVPHGCRSTFRSWAAEAGVPREVAEAALAHRLGDATEQAYSRSDVLDRRRAVMQRWAGYLTGAEGVVVKLGRGRQ